MEFKILKVITQRVSFIYYNESLCFDITGKPQIALTSSDICTVNDNRLPLKPTREMCLLLVTINISGQYHTLCYVQHQVNNTKSQSFRLSNITHYSGYWTFLNNSCLPYTTMWHLRSSSLYVQYVFFLRLLKLETSFSVK